MALVGICVDRFGTEFKSSPFETSVDELLKADVEMSRAKRPIPLRLSSVVSPPGVAFEEVAKSSTIMFGEVKDVA
jgi:hypothetical protein